MIDIAPTILEAVAVTPPTTYNGITQKPIEGTSMVYAFNDKTAEGRHCKQYFEMFINRAIYSDGWWAASRANIPWEGASPAVDPDTMKWELYHIETDYSQAVDLAAKEPQRLRQLQDLWWAEASKYQVLPLDGRKTVRLSAELQGRPSPTKGRTHFEYFPGTVALPAGSAPNILNKSFTITCHVSAVTKNVQGSVFSMGGSDGGYGIYVENGKPVFVCNFLGMKVTRIRSSAAMPQGESEIQVNFVYDGGGMGKGGTFTMLLNGKKVGEAKIDATQPITLGLGGALDVGMDSGSGVDESYTPPNKYTGKIKKVEIDIKP